MGTIYSFGSNKYGHISQENDKQSNLIEAGMNMATVLQMAMIQQN
jgi:hypothetical protein